MIQDTAWYVDADGGLDVEKLLAAFQQFFREHSEHWVARFDYAEAGPQLLLQAFLQRVVNSGGRIEREYGVGRGRTDLLIVWPQGGREEPESSAGKFVIECKVLHKSLEWTVREGLEQTAGYMDRCAAQAGHLVVFDRTEGKSWRTRSSGVKNVRTTAPSPCGGCNTTGVRGFRPDARGWVSLSRTAAARAARLTMRMTSDAPSVISRLR